MLLIFNKLDSTKKNSFLNDYLVSLINANFIDRIKELIKNNKVKIFDYDQIVTKVKQSITEPYIILELSIYANTDKDKINLLVSEYIRSKDLSKINAVIQLLRNYHSELNELQWKRITTIIHDNYKSLDSSKVNEIEKILADIHPMGSKKE